MKQLICNIFDVLRKAEKPVDDKILDRIFRDANRGVSNNAEHATKRKVVDEYTRIKAEEPEVWNSWNVDAELEAQFLTLLKLKPRRTTSGVATITVITEPHACTSNCLYCPCDVRMPKSYLHDEPACMRAEACWFDPYLQVATRLLALEKMGHVTDKIELIVLGSTWSDYSSEYQTWFIAELYRALNDANVQERAEERRNLYRELGIPNKPDDCAKRAEKLQERVTCGELSFGDAIDELYGETSIWNNVHKIQHASFEDLEAEQHLNEHSAHRVVGLVIETRPDLVSVEHLSTLRRLGCTKIQIGVQSLSPDILQANNRRVSIETIANAFELLRLFGFKIHAHLMVNLLGSTPENDITEYERFVSDSAFIPDEIKLYPCALIESSALMNEYKNGNWVPYTDENLRRVLVADVLATPPWIRISRMIRDFSAASIEAGNKVSNLRQLVEDDLHAQDASVQEIRYREVNRLQARIGELHMREHAFETRVSNEYFLEWVTDENLIAGFLRLSLPKKDAFKKWDNLPVRESEAMIREVHVYGAVAGLGENGTAVQHRGLGRSLIERAKEIAREAGFESINVISAIGTREYYRKLGFKDVGLYQQADL